MSEWVGGWERVYKLGGKKMFQCHSTHTHTHTHTHHTCMPGHSVIVCLFVCLFVCLHKLSDVLGTLVRPETFQEYGIYFNSLVSLQVLRSQNNSCLLAISSAFFSN